MYVCMCLSSLFLEQAYLWKHSLQIHAEKLDVYMLLFTELAKPKRLQIFQVGNISPDKNREIDIRKRISYLIYLWTLLQEVFI